MWRRQEGREVPVIEARELIEIKKTNREKDYAVIGELARLLERPPGTAFLLLGVPAILLTWRRNIPA